MVSLVLLYGSIDFDVLGGVVEILLDLPHIVQRGLQTLVSPIQLRHLFVNVSTESLVFELGCLILPSELLGLGPVLH